MHYGRIDAVLTDHAAAYAAAYAAHPERLVHGPPTPRRPPAVVYINPPARPITPDRHEHDGLPHALPAADPSHPIEENEPDSGEHYKEHTIERWMEQLVEEGKLPWHGTHVLRKTCGTRIADGDGGVSAVASHSTSSAGTSTSSESSAGGGSADTMPGSVGDLGGMPDFGDSSPAGCRGKIDFLFMISRQANMGGRQEQLALAFPQFIDTIQSKFADFDYHIMVVTGDDGWGNPVCNEACLTPNCKAGEQCCPWGDADDKDKLCCSPPDYPCDKQDLVTTCDWLWGAGEVFPAGVNGEANKPCPVEGGRRYLVKGQTDLKGTFECIARVGNSGWGALGQALAAAVQHNLNGPGGCNGGFLRDDALLMVTLIETNDDYANSDSEGTPAEWAQAVRDAKHGDDKSVVMFAIGHSSEGECTPTNRICQLATMFPYHHREHVEVVDYGPAFDQAVSLVETACAGFTPPPG